MFTKQTVALPQAGTIGGKGAATGKAVGWTTIAGGGQGAAIGSSMGIPYLMPIIILVTIGSGVYWLYERYQKIDRSTW
ncbi:MAG: hypothetical protein HN353_01765 [Bdellovibrionales bacterium]|jgi:hypothetical protein|nr:hypothetical protein [Bdellovibrionales bacterium]MBT3525392.1 hypothetical protein [Bdellovibrionales bacterium]MBT7766002.1 hypothetical protein [Bdellovibrionales bacterium]